MTQELSTVEALLNILSKKGAGTQKDLQIELEKLGLEVNQSTISRCLRKLGAVKIFGPNGEAVYQLPDEEIVPTVDASLCDLVANIVHNDFLIIIYTSPGSASLIARNLDHFGSDKILGTVAGDDTIFVAVPSGKSLKKTAAELKRFFGK